MPGLGHLKLHQLVAPELHVVRHLVPSQREGQPLAGVLLREDHPVHADPTQHLPVALVDGTGNDGLHPQILQHDALQHIVVDVLRLAHDGALVVLHPRRPEHRLHGGVADDSVGDKIRQRRHLAAVRINDHHLTPFLSQGAGQGLSEYIQSDDTKALHGSRFPFPAGQDIRISHR